MTLDLELVEHVGQDKPRVLGTRYSTLTGCLGNDLDIPPTAQRTLQAPLNNPDMFHEISGAGDERRSCGRNPWSFYQFVRSLPRHLALEDT